MQTGEEKEKDRAHQLVGQLKQLVGLQKADPAPTPNPYGGDWLHSKDSSSALNPYLPLEHTGPVPPELQTDPFAYDPTPWSLRQSEMESTKAEVESYQRMKMIWAASMIISWAVTATVVLRTLRII